MATFMDLVNDVLVAINETELTSADFSTAVGIHARARDVVNKAARKVATTYSQWPFMHKDGEDILLVGEQEYDLPDDALVVDFDTFRIAADDALKVPEMELKLISYDRWAKNYRSNDIDSTNSGGVPQYVFRHQDGKWGVSTKPDAEYTVHFEYWRKYEDMEDYDDVCVVPDEWTHVIHSYALYLIHMFRTDFEVATLFKGQYNDDITDMINVLVPIPPDLVSVQVER